MTSLTSLSGGSFIRVLNIEGNNGGLVDLTNLPAISGGATRITADGGTIDLSLAEELSDTNGNVSSWLRALNGGQVSLSAGTTVVNAFNITLSETGTISAGTVEVSSTSVLDGVGTLNASLVNHGRVRPGGSPGRQTIVGDFQQSAVGMFDVEIAGVTPVTEYDVLEVTGTATLDGTLNITRLNGFLPGELDRFDVVTFAAAAGEFRTVTGDSLSNLLVQNPEYGSSKVSLNTVPELFIQDVEVLEGDAGISQATFDLNLSVAVGHDVVFDFMTRDGFARGDEDYVSFAGQGRIMAGNSSTTITVDILGDPGLEREESFYVDLFSPVNVRLTDAEGLGSILNDDVLPAVRIHDASILEPVNGATAQLEFTVELSAPAPASVLVDFLTADDTAMAGSDYQAAAGVISFEPAAAVGLVSDGSDGEFSPNSNTTLGLPPDGILHFTSIHIPAGVTVTFTANAANTPAVLLARDDVRIDGTINVSANGRLGGVGGGDGGAGGVGDISPAGDGTDGTGLAPGTGGGATDGFVGSGGGGGGMATPGLGPTTRPTTAPGIGGAAIDLPANIAERGGSGGGGGSGWEKFGNLPGGDGGGGGGGIVIVTSHGTLSVNGAIRANGADGRNGFANAFGWGGEGGGGSGGVIDLQADTIVINGTLQAVGGEGGGISTIQPGNPAFSSGAHGGDGYIRLTGDAITVAGTIDGVSVLHDFDVLRTISVTVEGDAEIEATEQLLATLTAATGGVLTDATAIGTIIGLGDFDLDGEFEAPDVDALVSAIAAGSHDPQFDLTGDGLVDFDDLEVWVLDLKGTLFGDANLDFNVDVSDFNRWNSNKFTADTLWTGGDFNADGVNDVSDFNLWNVNKFNTANTPSADVRDALFPVLWEGAGPSFVPAQSNSQAMSCEWKTGYDPSQVHYSELLRRLSLRSADMATLLRSLAAASQLDTLWTSKIDTALADL